MLYYGANNPFEISAPRYWSTSACIDALRENQRLEPGHKKKLKISDDDLDRYIRRLNFLESEHSLMGLETHEKFIPAFKVNFKGRVFYISIEKYTAENLRMILADPDPPAVSSNHGGKRAGAGRKRLIDQYPNGPTIINDLIQLHSKSHDRRGDDVLKVGCSAGDIQNELSKYGISICQQSIRYLMQPPRAGSHDAIRYSGIIQGRIQR